MGESYIHIGAVKTKEIDGELYISSWDFSKVIGEKEREISDLCEEIDNLEGQLNEMEEVAHKFGDKCSKLESELAKKEALLKIREDWCKECKEKLTIEKLNATPLVEKPLPFSFGEYEGETNVELPEMPIDVASMLINATVEYVTPSIYKAFGAGETSFCDKYSKNDLKEIAEHLLVYCGNSDDDDM